MPRQTKVADHPESLPDLTFSQTHRNSYKIKKMTAFRHFSFFPSENAFPTVFPSPMYV